MKGSLVAGLRLVRLPNTLTAMADVVAGGLLAGLALDDARLWIAGLGSALIYGGGVGLNDVLDLEKDRRLHPDRVLPAGLLRVGTARTLSILLLVAGGLTALAHPTPAQLGVTAALIGLVVLYDLLPETRPGTAALTMGACRGANLLRGLVLAASIPPPALLAVAGHTALILLVTRVSQLEERDHGARDLRRRALALALPYLLPAAVAYGLAVPGSSWLPVAACAAGGIVLAVFVVRPAFRPEPRAGQVVFHAIFTLVLLDALLALAAQSPLGAALLAAFLPLMRVLARAIAQRGS